MSEKNPSLNPTEPVGILDKPIEIDYKELLKALVNGIGHVSFGKWDELGGDTADLLASLNLATQPNELAFLLIKRSIIKTVFSLIGESIDLLQFEEDEENQTISLFEKIGKMVAHEKFYLDSRFWEHPADLPVLRHLQAVLQIWLEGHGLPQSGAKAIVNRVPSYFIYTLNEEWRRNSKTYAPLIEALNTPFTQASEREWAWATYAALLQREVQKSVFDEPFSLRQIYVPLNAYYYVEKDDKKELDEIARHRKAYQERIVVNLQDELENWLSKADSSDTIRVISGGPGSGKSSFARIFAAHIANAQSKLKVLFIPLHLMDAAQELVTEVGRFVRDDGILRHNPLDPNADEPNLLIIFDGLDELASQGKAAAETAKNFIGEVQRTVDRRNTRKVKLRVLLSGRELIVQDNQSEFRKPRQVLNLLPYFVSENEQKEYKDTKTLLKQDLRQQWWQTYGALTNMNFPGLPKELNRRDLDEVTAQPLLNYLVGLSFIRSQTTAGGLDFREDINLNSIYADLVKAVYERGYEKRRLYASISHMKYDDFKRVLEEIGLAAWHGDGRTTTVSEIEEHCQKSGISKLLEPFKEGAEKGVTRLLAAFFFRQYGQRQNGDPTFVFTHKSFGEYLTAQRIVRAMERVAVQLDRRAESPDDGWDERDALLHWAIICGSSPISHYIRNFLLAEIQVRSLEHAQGLQKHFTKLFSYMLKHNSPMERAELKTFKEMLTHARNAEEALLVALNAYARKTKEISLIEHPDRTIFGAWLKRIQNQQVEVSLAVYCLSWLELSQTILYASDLFNSDLRFTKLVKTSLAKTDLEGAHLEEADLEEADLAGADLAGGHLEGARLVGAHLAGTNLVGAHLEGANLVGTNLAGADLVGANLEGANLEGANLEGANLTGANLEGADLAEANLAEANLAEANLAGARYDPKQFESTIGTFIVNDGDE